MSLVPNLYSRLNALENSTIGIYNVRDYGAVGDGVTDDATPIRAAINAAIAAGGGVVYFPKGAYLKSTSSAALPIGSNITFRGDGKTISVLKLDDTAGFAALIDSTVDAGIHDFALERMSFLGNRQADRSSSTVQLLVLRSVDGLIVRNCEIAHSRFMGLFASKCSRVEIIDNHVHHNNRDSIACWHYRTAIISRNTVEASWDDSISCHTTDGTYSDIVKTSLIVQGNICLDGKGIRILGGKVITCTDNIIRRVHGSGLNVNYDLDFNQGNTPLHSIIVKNNTVTDVFDNPIAGTPSVPVYMRIGGGFRNAGTGHVAAPGENDSVAGAIVDLYGADTGNFYVDNIDDTTVASPGGYFIEVSGNILVRTLPAVANYSDWGYGQLDTGPDGLYDGEITETDLKATGMKIQEAMKYSKVHHNTIYPGGTGLTFDVGSAADDLIFDKLEITDNQFGDCGQQCIEWPTSSISKQNIKFEGNIFDADPRHVHSNRGTNGNWLADSYPRGMYIPNLSGCVIESNEFFNCCNTITEAVGVYNVKRNNKLYCEPAAVGFSTSNRGIGNIPQASIENLIFPTSFDQTIAACGTVLNTMLSESSSIPTAGLYIKGHMVRNSSQSAAAVGITLGWYRLTTGVGHVDGTDWLTIKTVNIGANGEIGAGIAAPAGLFHSYKNNTSTSGTGLIMEQAGSGDSLLQWLLTSVQAWVMGIDNSDGNKLKCAASNNGFTSAVVFEVDINGRWAFAGTVTAGGTTGAQTINKRHGTVNAAAASTSLVVTNSFATAPGAYLPKAWLVSADASCMITSVVPGTGSFTINYVAPTLETAIGFEVLGVI